MANLKLIKVTGRPFSDGSIDRIGIQRTNYQFDIIREKTLYSQDSSYGEGWTYATAEEIAENWKLIYPHWTPEVGDRVIITQDFQDWANSRGTIVEKDGSSDYYRVESETGRSCIFDYTSQMILAPTTSTTSTTTVTETKSESPIGWQWQDLKVGDKVKIIGGDYSSRPVGSIFTIDKMENKDYGGRQPIKLIGSDGSDKGWPYKEHFEPYYGDVKKPKLQSKHGFTLGDRVLCVETSGPRANKTGTVVDFDGGSVGIAFEDYSSGHECNGHCPDGKGWYLRPEFIKHYTEPTKESKPKEETVIIRFLTEQEFKDKGLWRDSRPKGWNGEGEMNKYLGELRIIPKSRIKSDGSFKYEDWAFQVTDYIVTEWIPSSGITSSPVIDTKPERPLRRFKVGDKVTYKSRGDSYHYGGDDQEGFVGTVEHTGDYVEDKGCYCLRVTTKEGDFCYNMLESEFKEYDSGYVPITSGAVGSSQPATRLVIRGSSAAGDGKHILVGGVAYPIRHYSSDGTTVNTVTTPTLPGHVDPLSSYKQKPITIKQKPKTKLTIV